MYFSLMFYTSCLIISWKNPSFSICEKYKIIIMSSRFENNLGLYSSLLHFCFSERQSLLLEIKSPCKRTCKMQQYERTQKDDWCIFLLPCWILSVDFTFQFSTIVFILLTVLIPFFKIKYNYESAVLEITS